MSKDSLGDRQKLYYEKRSQTYLRRRSDVMMRLDGKAFHTYVKGLNRPFDLDLIEDMNATALALCKVIQGAKMAFVQSDEITIWITDYDDLVTQAWYDYNVQKMTSISASIATANFNLARWERGIKKIAEFDSRVWTIPKQEVLNCFIWRQNDCTRNSVQSVAQAMFSQKQLHGMKTDALQEMIFQDNKRLRDILFEQNVITLEDSTKETFNWNDLAPELKRGRIIVKEYYDAPVNLPNEEGVAIKRRSGWFVKPAPIFTQNQAFLEEYLLYLESQTKTEDNA